MPRHAKKANFSDNADYRAVDFKITNIAVWVILNREYGKPKC